MASAHTKGGLNSVRSAERTGIRATKLALILFGNPGSLSVLLRFNEQGEEKILKADCFSIRLFIFDTISFVPVIGAGRGTSDGFL